MPSDESLLAFLENKDRRVPKLATSAKMLMKTDKFCEGVADLESKFPGSKCYFFGTRPMKLGHPKSHLNLFLDLDNSYWNTQSPDKVDKMMQTLQEYFKSLPDFKPPFFKPLSVVAELDQEFRSPDSLWREPLRTLKIPVPTLRVTHKRLQCDITFSNGLGVENTRLLHHMFSLQPEAFKLYHFVRIWIHIDEFAFKRYMVALLVVFYLQNKNLMPSVLKMQEDTGEKFIAGWNVEFNYGKKLTDYGMELIKSYTDHLIGFFEFYGNFNFTDNVICPYLGREIPVSAYPGDDEDLKKYKDNIKNFIKAAVNVTDLTNLNFNCAHGVGKKRLMKFNNFCPHAAELLRNHLH